MRVLTSLPLIGLATAIKLPDTLVASSQNSIRNVAATIAHDTMSYYNGNQSDVKPVAIGDVQDPYYWWVAGGLWGMMLDYYHYTKDPSYNDVVLQALLAKVNLGPEQNYMPPEHKLEEGNDDLFFWGSAVLSAAERNFPQPDASLPSWLDISTNVFNQLESRWDTKDCGGGIFWQIRSDNPNGMTYKNTVSNGGFFQLAARLARATGNNTYVDWADKVWDWSWNLGFIDNKSYRVYDGSGIDSGCKKTNFQAFTYTTGIYMYGAAVMANFTGKAEWADRAEKLLDGASWFFWNKAGAENILYEGACETVDRCWLANADMTTFKGFFSEFMWKTAVMLPGLRPKIESYMLPTSKAAAKSCSGGNTGTLCGERWYTGKFEGRTGLGPQMCALGAIQGLLAEEADAPLGAASIKRISDANFAPVDPNRPDSVTSTAMVAPATTSKTEPTTKSVEPVTTSTSEKPSSTSSSMIETTTTSSTLVPLTTSTTLHKTRPVHSTTTSISSFYTSQPVSTQMPSLSTSRTNFTSNMTQGAPSTKTSKSLVLTTFVESPPSSSSPLPTTSSNDGPPETSAAESAKNNGMTLLFVALAIALATWGMA